MRRGLKECFRGTVDGMWSGAWHLSAPWLSLSPSSAPVAPGDQLHALPYAGKKSRPFWYSQLVYALTRLSVSLEDGILTPSFLMPPSNSGENKWAIHAKREKRVSPEGEMPPTNSTESHWLFIYIHTF